MPGNEDATSGGSVVTDPFLFEAKAPDPSGDVLNDEELEESPVDDVEPSS